MAERALLKTILAIAAWAITTTIFAPSCVSDRWSQCPDHTRGKVMTETNTATQFKENQKVFFVLKNGAMYGADEAAPKSFYVQGHIKNGAFMIESDVLGGDELATSGRPGWLEIPAGQFYSQETARSVASPYVNGYMTDAGFVPSSRQVR